MLLSTWRTSVPVLLFLKFGSGAELEKRLCGSNSPIGVVHRNTDSLQHHTSAEHLDIGILLLCGYSNKILLLILSTKGV
jgi:hypothetical protein